MKIEGVNITTFVFPSVEDYSAEIMSGSEIVDWIDQQIKKSPFNKIDLIEMSKTSLGGVRLIYSVTKTHIASDHNVIRHLALQDVNLN